MRIQQGIDCGSFIYCSCYLSPNQKVTHLNAGDGHFHQWLYLVEGSAKAEVKHTADGPNIYERAGDPVGTLVDETDTLGKYVVTTTDDDGMACMLFNPIPATNKLDVQIIKGAGNHKITATDKRITIVAISGPVTVNGKEVGDHQYAKLFTGKTAEIEMSEHGVIALVTTV